jgi:hypothetical protein
VVLVVVLLVVELVVVVVELVVVVVAAPPHAGSIGSVQEQHVVWQLLITSSLHVLRAMPDKPAHAVAISSAQVLAVHFPTALASETKTPAQSATAGNVTTALLVIVAPSLWPFPCATSTTTHYRRVPHPHLLAASLAETWYGTCAAIA